MFFWLWAFTCFEEHPFISFVKISNNFSGSDTQGSIHGTEVSGLDNTCYLDIHLLRLATQPHQVARRLSLRIGVVPKDSLPSNKTEGVVYWDRLHTSSRVCSYSRTCSNMSLLHNSCCAHQNCIQPCVDKHLFLHNITANSCPLMVKCW